MFAAIDRAWDRYRVDQLIAGYQEAENAVLRAVTVQIKRQLRNPSRIPSVPRAQIGALRKLRPPNVEAMIREVEKSVRAKAERDLGSSTRSDSGGSTADAGRIIQEIRLARNNAASLYRRSLSDALSDALSDPTGTEAQRTLNRTADRGLRTTQGNESLTSFTKRSIRSALSNTALMTYTSVMQENGHDLVVVSNEAAECPICRRFEGKVLSVSGSTSKYTSLAMAKVEGLFHPNCRHSVSAFMGQDIEGDKDETGRERQEGEAQTARRQDRLQRRVSVALTPDTKHHAQRRLIDTA